MGLDIGIFTILAGVAAFVSVIAFFSFLYSAAQDKKFKNRMAAVKDQRAALRSDARSAIAERSSGETAAMSRALDKLNLQNQLSDKDLKMRLIRAGKRDRSDLVRFVFLRTALPPVLGALFYAAYTFGLKPETFDLTMTVAVVLCGVIVGYMVPGMMIDKATSARQKAIVQAYPDALDLLTICVEAGMSVEQSFNKVASELGANAMELSEEFQVTTAELSYLGDRRQAFENLAERTNLSQVKSITSALIQAEKYGTPLGQALRVISQESRFDRMTRAETKAAALPAKLTVPMMLFFMPVLFIVILTPAMIQVMEQMS
ncbi:MAG: type II secretion system F family protein [Pseudomonadota bacterium]